MTLVKRALDKCFDKAEGLKSRDAESLGALLEALTRPEWQWHWLLIFHAPASGAEHMSVTLGKWITQREV